MNSRAKLMKERRETLPLDQRKVEALELIADALMNIRSELMSITASMKAR